MFLYMIMFIKQKVINHIKWLIKQINIKNRTYYFYNDIIDLKKFDVRLLEVDKKSYKNTGIYNIGYIAIKKLMIVKVFTVWILYICVLIMQTDIYWRRCG